MEAAITKRFRNIVTLIVTNCVMTKIKIIRNISHILLTSYGFILTLGSCVKQDFKLL